MNKRLTVFLFASGVALASCAGSRPQFPPGVTPREAGCVVELMREGIPTRPVRMLSNVNARCTGEIAADRSRCERLLMDEACRRGAQVLWDYRQVPYESDGIELRASAGAYR
jgi:hypothetical protein